MSDRQPNFEVGDRVLHSGYVGVVKKVIKDGPSKYKYRVEFQHNTLTVPEGRLRRA
ncbi:hypothetical protein HWB76_gp095 [Streptomyces phage Blueeyedbeauty]|uniref:Uncharacterized protein n=1 Tax=Streptomyces phage Blueeyedbeauty TaxID=2250336 RepID=A0A345L204_9CAUD|nr:hypothetical protein HWB76_gp095 [Streptomyces phage Blueeyedbeauty]AXH49306.1 hypothetical protein SEA_BLUEEYEDBEAUTY_198 [Streptomyces phage Blueeyedbeauty]